jgi:hypothetical protein
MSPLVAHLRFVSNAESIAREIEHLANWQLESYTQSPLDPTVASQLRLAVESLERTAQIVRRAKEIQQTLWDQESKEGGAMVAKRP